MTLEHLRVVLAVEAALVSAALPRARWDTRSRRRAVARGGLVKGKLDLASEAVGFARDASHRHFVV